MHGLRCRITNSLCTQITFVQLYCVDLPIYTPQTGQLAAERILITMILTSHVTLSQQVQTVLTE